MALPRRWLSELDELLRGKKTESSVLAVGTDHIRMRPYVVSAVLLGVIYGVFMGLYAVMTREPPCWEQMLAAAVKVPAVFFLTLVVTFPSLYVFSALLGSRLRLLDSLRMLVSAITVNLCVLAAFGPITGFFTISTTSYRFMLLLNVLFFAIAGFLGVGFLFRVLRTLEETATGGQKGQAAGTQRLLTIWLVLYATVGAQMGWILRPFVGSPTMEFSWFREREGNFFISVLQSLAGLLGLGG